jgi:hypothetical protein
MVPRTQECWNQRVGLNFNCAIRDEGTESKSCGAQSSLKDVRTECDFQVGRIVEAGTEEQAAEIRGV